MKYLLLLFYTFACISCNDDDDSQLSWSLPTDEAANTFGCRIDGAIFVSEDRGEWVPPQLPVLSATYGYVPEEAQEAPGYYLSIYANNEFTSRQVAIGVAALSEPLAAGSVYPLSLQQSGNGHAQYMFTTNTPHPTMPSTFIFEEHRFKTTDEHTGQLTITYIDEANQIIMGTFSFSAINTANNTTSQISEGHFNVKYSPAY